MISYISKLIEHQKLILYNSYLIDEIYIWLRISVNVTNLFLKLSPEKECSMYLLLHRKPHENLEAKNINCIHFAHGSTILLGLDWVGSLLLYLVSSGTAQRQRSWKHWRFTCSFICLAVDDGWLSKQLHIIFSCGPRLPYNMVVGLHKQHSKRERSRRKPTVKYDLALSVMKHHFYYIVFKEALTKRVNQVQGEETVNIWWVGVTRCWIFLCSYKYFWALFWDAVKVTWKQFDSFQSYF